jgi:predicted acetyltransferase
LATDIRVLTADDIERWKLVNSTAFNDPPEVTEREVSLYEPDWTLAAFVDGELQACVSSIPFELWLEGAAVPMGGVSSVATMPEYRRQGLAGELLRLTLERTHERRQPLSSLWTPHPALYRRYGWEIATLGQRLSFNPKRLQVAPPTGAGKIERIGPDDWRDASRVYSTWRRTRNSLLGRSEVFWRRVVLEGRRRAAFLYRDAAGEPAGYAVLGLPDVGGRTVTVRDLVAVTGEAYLALLNLVLSHDLANEVTWWAPMDEPLREVAVDPGAIEASVNYGLLLRVVDLQEALSRRPAYGEGRVVIELDDRDCPWNTGRWEVFHSGSHLDAERTDDEPMLVLDARALAQLYNGFRSATSLVQAGRIEARDARGVLVAERLFAMRSTPFCGDDF